MSDLMRGGSYIHVCVVVFIELWRKMERRVSGGVIAEKAHKFSDYHLS